MARRLRPFEHAYNHLLRAAKARSKSVSLTYRQYLTFTKIDRCHYCHSLIDWSMFGGLSRKNWSYYLDRKENSGGYSLINCVVCCTRCNMSKGSRYSYEEWYEMNKVFRKRKACLH